MARLNLKGRASSILNVIIITPELKQYAQKRHLQCSHSCNVQIIAAWRLSLLDLWFITEWSEIETLYIMAWPQKGPHMSSIAFLKPLEPGPKPKAFGYNTVPAGDKKPTITGSISYRIC